MSLMAHNSNNFALSFFVMVERAVAVVGVVGIDPGSTRVAIW